MLSATSRARAIGAGRTLRALFTGALGAILAWSAPAGTPRLVLDINSQVQAMSSDPVPLGRLGDRYLFGARNVGPGGTGGGLYGTDFTPAGTTLIRSFTGTGPMATADPIALLPAGGRAYFVAEESTMGFDVWVTDGTADGTRVVADIGGEASAPPRLIGLLGSDLVFVQQDASSAYQLFRTDGTPAGTRALTTFSSSQSVKDEVVIHDGRIYFLATGSVCCDELWVSDGTAAGTHAITDPVTLPAGVSLQSLSVLGDALLFIGSTPTDGAELRRLDTTTGTVTKLDLNPGPAAGVLGGIVVLDGFALFAGTNAGALDYELWRTDGTLAGTTRVKDIFPGPEGGIQPSLTRMFRAGDRVLFLARDNSNNVQLWGSDGTELSTVSLTAAAGGIGVLMKFIGVAGTRLYFGFPLGGTLLGGTAYRVMATDGTVAGTGIVEAGLVRSFEVDEIRLAGDDSAAFLKIVGANPSTMQFMGGVFLYEPAADRTTLLATTASQPEPSLIGADAGRLFYSTYDETLGNEPRVSDGTVAGTVLLANLAPEGVTESSSPQMLTGLDDELVFLANDGVHGIEPWQSDGTAEGTNLLLDATPGPGGTAIDRPFSWNGGLYFFTDDGTGQDVFVRWIGTSVQTLALVAPPAMGACARPLYVAMGTRLYFTAGDAEAGMELWSTDGTPQGTRRVADIQPGPASSTPCGLTVFNSRLYFAADGGSAAGGRELWSSDGTTSGTQRVLDLMPGATGSDPGVGFVYDGALYFTAIGPVGGAQLWRTDGTAEGTRPVVEVSPGGSGFLAFPLGETNGKLVLVQSLSTSPPRWALWVSDGTAAGTVRITGAELAPASPVLVKPDLIYFAGTGPHGIEPWVSDGTEAGTRMLVDLNPGGDSSPSRFVDFNGVTIIAATDLVNGSSLWRTDGTAEGTVLLGSTGEAPASFTVAGQNLFFTAVDATMGRELHVLPNDAPIAGSDSAQADNGQRISIDVLANDFDSDGSLDRTSVRIVSAPARGSATVGPDGSITYVPNAGYSGTDSFTYSVADNQGHFSEAASVTVQVTAAAGSGGGGGSSGGGGGGGAFGLLELLLLLAGLGASRTLTAVARHGWRASPAFVRRR